MLDGLGALCLRAWRFAPLQVQHEKSILLLNFPGCHPCNEFGVSCNMKFGIFVSNIGLLLAIILKQNVKTKFSTAENRTNINNNYGLFYIATYYYQRMSSTTIQSIITPAD